MGASDVIKQALLRGAPAVSCLAQMLVKKAELWWRWRLLT